MGVGNIAINGLGRIGRAALKTGDSRASVVDLNMTRVVDGTLAKIMSWYDN